MFERSTENTCNSSNRRHRPWEIFPHSWGVSYPSTSRTSLFWDSLRDPSLFLYCKSFLNHERNRKKASISRPTGSLSDHQFTPCGRTSRAVENYHYSVSLHWTAYSSMHKTSADYSQPSTGSEVVFWRIEAFRAGNDIWFRLCIFSFG